METSLQAPKEDVWKTWGSSKQLFQLQKQGTSSQKLALENQAGCYTKGSCSPGMQEVGHFHPWEFLRLSHKVTHSAWANTGNNPSAWKEDQRPPAVPSHWHLCGRNHAFCPALSGTKYPISATIKCFLDFAENLNLSTCIFKKSLISLNAVLGFIYRNGCSKTILILPVVPLVFY